MTSDAPSPDFDAVLFDFGGVIMTSPFDGFARYEAEHGLPDGFIRGLNAADHHTNAWACFERNEITFDEFCDRFEGEAKAAGGGVDARALFSMLQGEIRPAMVEAVRRCREHFSTALLTNNFVTHAAGDTATPALAHFDVVIESSVVGVRKPDPEFYRLACRALDIEPGRAVFLDDLGINLKPARALGMTTIKVGDPDQALDELAALIGVTLR